MDCCYAQFKQDYKAVPQSGFAKSYHNMSLTPLFHLDLDIDQTEGPGTKLERVGS